MTAKEAREKTLNKRKENMANIYYQIEMKASQGSFYINWAVDGGFQSEEIAELIENGFKVERDMPIPLIIGNSTVSYKISWYPED